MKVTLLNIWLRLLGWTRLFGRGDLVQFVAHQDGIQSVRRDGKDGPFWLWEEVTQIDARKVDCMVHDEIAVDFVTERGKFTILEGHNAFLQLTTQLSDQFGAPEGWYFAAAELRSSRDRLTLYRREKGQQRAGC